MRCRAANILRLHQGVYDALIVGGGINGAVSAAALAGQGARVALIDRLDFAGFTSQQSSNLAWGGIKYLQNGDYRLVRSLCLGRNALMRRFPSRVREIRFLAAVERDARLPTGVLWLGAWVYWLLGNGLTRPPRYLSPGRLRREEPLIDADRAAGAVEYSDAYLPDNDARFVFQFVACAMDQGGVAANYVESLGARREGGVWVTRIRDRESGEDWEVRSRVLINAAGPFVDAHNRLSGQDTRHRHLFSKGIHLVVPRVSPRQRVLTLFAEDGRPFFVIPMGACSCIGTTDTRVEDPDAGVTEADRDLVLDTVNRRLRLARPLTRADIVAERCGVRPLVVSRQDRVLDRRDWKGLSRRHLIEVDRDRAHISIFGGKLTDCLHVGGEVAAMVSGLGIALPGRGRPWCGESPGSVRREFLRQASRMDLDRLTSPGSGEPLASRLWRRYDRQAFALLAQIRSDPRQGEVLIEGTDYRRCEIEWARGEEMIVTLDDLLRRRCEIALVVPRATLARDSGLMEACRILFGDQAKVRYNAYFGGAHTV